MNTACCCELAVQQSIFEKHQSCVCATVTLSHRFKAFLPPFCVQNWFRYEPPEVFCKTTSDRALNRPRSPEVRKPLVYFWYFSYTRKVRKTSPLQEVPRLFKPRISSHRQQLRTATIKTFVKELRGSANLELAHKDDNFAEVKLNPFRTVCLHEKLALISAAHSVCFSTAFGGIILVAAATFVPLSAAFSGGFAASFRRLPPGRPARHA